MPSWDDVVASGLRFPGVEVSTSDALVMRVSDMGEREALLQGEPGAFFTIPHYDGYPYVLARLEAVDPVELDELVEDAWRTRAPKRLIEEHDRTAG